MNRKVLFIIAIALQILTGSLKAQLITHISYAYNGLSNGSTSDLQSSTTSNLNRVGVGLEYRFKHSYYRWYGAPVMGWNHFDQSKVEVTDNIETKTHVNTNIYTLGFRTSIYPFNLQGDCNCPTWTRENPFFKRGFYIFLTPQIAVLHGVNKVETKDIDLLIKNSLGYAQIGGGVGLDIGLGPRFTLTPELMMQSFLFRLWSITNLPLNKNIYGEYFDNKWQLMGNLRFEYRFSTQ